MRIDLANLHQKEARELLVGAALPRPIALVSTIGEYGIYNLAPFSFFIPMSVKPAIVGLGIGRKRDGTGAKRRSGRMARLVRKDSRRLAAWVEVSIVGRPTCSK